MKYITPCEYLMLASI